MKVGIAQINSKVGDFPYNAKRILQAYRACLDQGADLVVTPANALCGYPLLSLARQAKFTDKCLQALDYLGDEVKDVPLLVGHVTMASEETKSAATLLKKGNNPLTVLGDAELVTCHPEDLCIQNLTHSIRLASIPSQFSDAPSMMTKEDYLQCNPVGANDGAIFMESSFVKRGGAIKRVCPPIDEAHTVIDLSSEISEWDDYPKPSDTEQLQGALVLGIRDFVSKGGYNGVCILDDDSPKFSLLSKLAQTAQVDVKSIVLTDTDLSDYQKLERIHACCEEGGLLYLSAGTKAQYFLGESACMELDFGGLAVLADVWDSQLQLLAEWTAKGKLADTEVVLTNILAGASIEELVRGTRLSENFIRGIVRKYNLSHAKRRFIPLKLLVSSNLPLHDWFQPVNQTFVD